MNKNIFHMLCFQPTQNKQNFSNFPISHQFNYIIFHISGYKSFVDSNLLDYRIKNSVNSFSIYEEIKKQLQHATLISTASQCRSSNSITCSALWNPSLCPHPLGQVQK